MDEASVHAHRKQSSRPVQAAQGDADGFQERAGDPLTQVQDSTGPIRRFLRRSHSHHKRSLRGYLLSAESIVCGNAGSPKGAETRAPKFHSTVASALVAARVRADAISFMQVVLSPGRARAARRGSRTRSRPESTVSVVARPPARRVVMLITLACAGSANVLAHAQAKVSSELRRASTVHIDDDNDNDDDSTDSAGSTRTRASTVWNSKRLMGVRRSAIEIAVEIWTGWVAFGLQKRSVPSRGQPRRELDMALADLA